MYSTPAFNYLKYIPRSRIAVSYCKFCLTFGGAILYSTVSALFFIPTSKAHGFNSSTVSPTLVHFCLSFNVLY